MCGIVGIVGKSNVNQALYDALTVLQHRGRDAARIRSRIMSSQFSSLCPRATSMPTLNGLVVFIAAPPCGLASFRLMRWP